MDPVSGKRVAVDDPATVLLKARLSYVRSGEGPSRPEVVEQWWSRLFDNLVGKAPLRA